VILDGFSVWKPRDWKMVVGLQSLLVVLHVHARFDAFRNTVELRYDPTTDVRQKDTEPKPSVVWYATLPFIYGLFI